MVVWVRLKALAVFVLIMALAVIPLKVVAAESKFDCGQIPL